MEQHKTPHCLAFIMDGNRRWAKERGLPTLEGHRKGEEVFMDYVRFVRDEKIPHAVFYAFSTENWKRTSVEVNHLIGLFSASIARMSDTLNEQGVRIRFVGQRQDFSQTLQTQMIQIEEKSFQFSETTIWIALSYGGRAELIEAVNKAVAKGELVDETSFTKLLWTAELPDPDMIVRTGGNERLSNFLTWKSVYSELYFIKTLWPALTKADFEDILLQYEKRERRQGA